MSAVDEVKARLDIVDVVGGYVRLQKAGRYYRALCPFHNEKTPSFIVQPERQSWRCFGACGTGGDVIAFVARKENLDFAGALRLLAERAGVELRGDGRRREEMRTLQDANEAAALFYHGLLQNVSPARAYVEERGLDRGAVSDFLLGYAPAGWDGLRGNLLARGFAEAQLVEAGLLIEGERGTYDRFRDRLMFPIRDDRGRVVGFGGRVLPGGSEKAEQGPKYMNTPQTPIFDKGGVLYGLDRAKDDIRSSSTAVIVEGYMDVIAAHQHGFRNVVASMGTSLTDKQAALCQRFAERVVLAMDADEAGSAANLRAVQVVATAAERPGRAGVRPKRLDIRVLALPQGKDPDELIRADASAWTAAVEAARPVVDHYYAIVCAGKDLTNPRDRQVIADEMLPLIAEIDSPNERGEWLHRVARGDRALQDELWREIRRLRSSRARGRTAESDASEQARPVVRPETAAAAAKEEFCLALLYLKPELGRLADELSEELFSLSENRELFRRWRAGEAVLEEETELWEHYQNVLKTRVHVTETEQAEVALLDCVERLEQGRMRAVKEASALALAEGEAGVRPGQVASIARAKLSPSTGSGRGAGSGEESPEDADPEVVGAASRLLEDMEAGLRFHRRLIEGQHPDHPGSRSTP